jgi:ribosomal protein L16 Arg81 hydroxylase
MTGSVRAEPSAAPLQDAGAGERRLPRTDLLTSSARTTEEEGQDEFAMTDPSLSFEQLIRPVGCRAFFKRYWQRRSLSVHLEEGVFARILAEVGPLDIVAMAKAARRGVQAWISGPHILHSVFEADANNVGEFGRVGATLYFVDVPLPGITEQIADALGAPRRRLRASLFLTPGSIGASPHFDSNENFTIQLTGSKRWYVESSPLAIMPPVGHVIGHRPAPSVENLIVRGHRPSERCFDLKPGTFLYVPRGTVHRTSAGSPSWSLNICYSGTTWLDLLQESLQQRLVASERWRSMVTGASKACEPEAVSGNIFPELIDELRHLLDDPKEVENLCGAFLGARNAKP